MTGMTLAHLLAYGWDLAAALTLAGCLVVALREMGSPWPPTATRRRP